MAKRGVRTIKVTVPAGKYVVGDPCYAVPDEAWDGWLDAGRDADVLAAVIPGSKSGIQAVGVSTVYGDGCYESNVNFDFGVDAGLLGLVPLADAQQVRDNLSLVVKFDEPATCYRDGYGVVHLGHIEIITGDYDASGLPLEYED